MNILNNFEKQLKLVSKFNGVCLNIEEKTKLEIQDLQPLQLEQFKVETKSINGISYILLDVHNFTKLSNNLEKMKIYIEKQHAIINTYKDYYENQ